MSDSVEVTWAYHWPVRSNPTFYANRSVPPRKRTYLKDTYASRKVICEPGALLQGRERYAHPGCSLSSFSRLSGPILGILISPRVTGQLSSSAQYILF